MTEQELQQFKELAKKYTRGADKEAVKKIVAEDMHEVFQDINDGGHSAATKASTEKISTLETQVKALETRAVDAEGKLKELDGKAPDAAKLRETYEKREKDLRGEYEERERKLREQADALVKEKDKTITSVRLENARKALVEKLTGEKLGVEKEYAETIIVNKPEVNDRLRAEADGSIKVLKPGSTDMFIVPAEGRDPLDHLAEELAEKVDDRWKTSGAGRGSGTTGSSGGAGKGTAERFENTRKRIQEREKTEAESRKGGSALERLGARR